MELTDFLLARITEDEALARAATAGAWLPNGQGWADGRPFLQARHHELDVEPADALHITHWQPTRVLAECATKRGAVAAYAAADGEAGGWSTTDAGIKDGLHLALRWLSLPYAFHRDYRPEWVPTPPENDTA